MDLVDPRIVLGNAHRRAMVWWARILFEIVHDLFYEIKIFPRFNYDQ